MTMNLPPYMPDHRRRDLDAHQLADVLRVTLRFGILLLRSGTTSLRVDEAMTRVALVLGVERIANFVTPTGIISTVFCGREHRTQIERVGALGVDMNRVCELELLSRNLPIDASVESVNAAVERIEKKPAIYSRPVVTLSVAAACGALAVILNGGPLEFAAAALGAGVAQMLRFRLVSLKIRTLPVVVACAFVATLVSWGFLRLAYPLLLPTLLATGLTLPNARAGVVASVLLLVPGVPLVTAFLDIIRFDLIAGLARGVYAFTIFVSIAIGMLLVLSWAGFSII
jgi:uncharacterized membrane protein YjjP (DUF1212 family)